MTRPATVLSAGPCTVRSARPDDAPSIARHADNRNVWLHLRDAFPNPYELADARRFIRAAAKHDPETHFVIEAHGEVIGAIGYRLQDDVDRASAEIGYWIAEACWGRGMATAALAAVTAYAFERHHELHRIFAVPFAGNPASQRVLEKVGYRLEGRLRNSAIKDGHLIDQLQYAASRDTWRPPSDARSSSG
jgi:RimJ/RimL family protein N-acetyltransferase